MYCNQCGQINTNDAKFCSGCGNKLEGANIQSSSPILEQAKSPQPRKKQIELWNPNAAANWSLLFSPAFGAYLHMKNWEALGKYEEAKGEKFWLFITIGVIFFLNFISPFVWDDPVKLLVYPKAIWFLYVIFWYSEYTGKQSKYVKENLNNKYQKKSWTAPLLSAIVIFFVSGLAILAVSDVIVQKTQSKQSAKTTQPNYFDQFDEKKPEEKNIKNGW